MIYFDNSRNYLPRVIDANGIVLRDVEGYQAAIANKKLDKVSAEKLDGIAYKSAFDFVTGFIEAFGIIEFAKKLGYNDVKDMLSIWGLDEKEVLSWCVDSFDGMDAEAYADYLDEKYRVILPRK